MMIPSILDTYKYITTQSGCKDATAPIIDLGKIDIDTNFLDEVVKTKPFSLKRNATNITKLWQQAVAWSCYTTVKRDIIWVDDQFTDLNEKIVNTVRTKIPNFEICFAGIFVLYPGGYIAPHIDRPEVPNELYLPFNWPEGMHMGWKDYGKAEIIPNTLYAFDTSKEHAIVNLSDDIRYAYIIGPKDTEGFKSIFTQDNT
jgi:hypothetical protein